MEQLELREYSREEMAEILSLNTRSSNFRRDVLSKLEKWGYTVDYPPRRSITILSRPETPEERLREILIRVLNMDVQINPIQFACFIAAFNSIDGFEGMPWAERVEALHERYGFYVCERTLSNWCSKLYALGIITRAGTSSAWMTTISNGLKTRRRLQPEEQEEIEAYFRRRGELQQEFYKESTLPPIEARKTSYRSAYSILWQEYGCCYYYCKALMLGINFDGYAEEIFQIYELVDEINPDFTVIAPAIPPAAAAPASANA